MILSPERLGIVQKVASSRKALNISRLNLETVDISVSSGVSDVATAASSCWRKWYIRGLSMDIQITKEKETGKEQ